MQSILSATIVYPSVMFALVLALWLAVRWFRHPEDRKRTEWLLVAAVLAAPLSALAEATAGWLTHLRPSTFDQWIYLIDQYLGQPSFVLARHAHHHISLLILISVSYGLLNMAMVGTFAAYLWLASEKEALTTVKLFALNLFAAIPFYLLIPVSGPAFAFPGFPFVEPAHLVPHLIAPGAAPNGIPSVHASSAMLVYWLLRRWWWGKLAGGVFLALTLFSTMASGQHYAFDLISAVPYAVAVYWAATRLHIPKFAASRQTAAKS